MQTVHAHYDGNRVELDEPLPLQKDDKLLITLIERTENRKKQFPSFTAKEMEQFIGKFPLGGDALEDTERLYE